MSPRDSLLRVLHPPPTPVLNPSLFSSAILPFSSVIVSPLFPPCFSFPHLLAFPSRPPSPFTILSPPPPLPLGPRPSAFPLPLVGCPPSPARTSVPFSFFRLQGAKQEQFEGDCFPGAVGRARTDSKPAFPFSVLEGRRGGDWRYGVWKLYYLVSLQ